MINKLGGRKVIFGFVFLTVSVVLALVLGDLPPHLMQFLIFLSSAFFIGNAVEHSADAVKEKKQDTSGDLSSRLESIHNTLGQQAQVSAEGIGAVQTALSVILKTPGIGPKVPPTGR